MIKQMSISYLNDDTSWFPHPSQALIEPAGLLAIGGDLSTSRIFSAYKQGVFPWYCEDEPIMWWSPDPRAIIPPNAVRINKTLTKFLKKCDYSVSINTAFEQVIVNCSKPRSHSEGTWITPEMTEAYVQLHKEQKAHSIEVWQINSEGKTLVGGLYGILVGSCFCGESMFSFQANASKLALICLANLLKDESDAFIDCQLPNPYLMDMGAQLISRDVYLSKLQNAQTKIMQNNKFMPRFIHWQSSI